MTRRRTQAEEAPVTLNKPTFRVPAFRSGGGVTAQMSAMQRDVAAPYETAAQQSRLPNVGNPGPISLANFQARNRSLSRHFMRTDSIYRSVHNNLGMAVVGTGPVPTSPYRDLMPLWSVFCRHIDIGRTMPFGLQLLTGYTDSHVAGDLFGHLHSDTMQPGEIIPLHLDLIESEHLPYLTQSASNGNPVVTGIEFRNKRREAYWIYPHHPYDVSPVARGSNTPERIPAESVVHLYRPNRPSAVRGEPIGVPSFVNLWRMHGYLDSEMERKRVVSGIAAFLKSVHGEPVIPGQADEREANVLIDQLKYELGSMWMLPEGVDVTFPTVQDTSGNAMAFNKLMGQLICAPIGVPYELAFGDWSGVSDRTAVFSSTYFQTFIEMERARIEYQVLAKIWERFVRWCEALGLWTPPTDLPEYRWFEVEWTWPVRSYKHPVQDIQAKLLAMKAGLVDRDSLIKELGYDPSSVDLRQAIAQIRARQYGLKYDAHVDLAEGDDTSDATPAELERVVADEVARLVEELVDAEADKSVLAA